MQQSYTVFLVGTDIATNYKPGVLPGYIAAGSTRAAAVRNTVQRAIRLGFLLSPVMPLIIEHEPTHGMPLPGDDHHVGLWLLQVYDMQAATYFHFINFAHNRDDAMAVGLRPMYAMGVTNDKMRVSLCRNFGRLTGPLLNEQKRMELCLAAQGFLNFYTANDLI